MEQATKIAKVAWEARKGLRPWDGENTLKKWSSAYQPEKKLVVEAIQAYIESGTVPILKDWTDDEIKLLCAITDCLKVLAI